MFGPEWSALLVAWIKIVKGLMFLVEIFGPVSVVFRGQLYSEGNKVSCIQRGIKYSRARPDAAVWLIRFQPYHILALGQFIKHS